MTALLALERSCAPRTAEAAVPARSIFPHDPAWHQSEKRPGAEDPGLSTLSLPSLIVLLLLGLLVIVFGRLWFLRRLRLGSVFRMRLVLRTGVLRSRRVVGL